MLSLARRAIATAKCSLPARAARGRPKEDPARLRKVRELLLTQAGVNEMAFGSLLNVRRHLSEVHPEQLGENLAFWRQQFGLTRDELNVVTRNCPEALALDPDLLAERWATLKQALGEERLGQYARLGLSTDEVLSAYRLSPQLMELNHDSLRDTVDALLELGYDSSMKDKLLKSTHTLDILCRASAPIRQTADVLREAGYSPNAIGLLSVSGYYPAGSPSNLAQSLAYVRDVMGWRVEDINPAVFLRCSVPRNVAPRHGAALDDATTCHKSTGVLAAEAAFLKSGRITREAYDEVRRLTVPRFVVLWKEGELLPPPDVALIEGDEAFLQQVGRADLLPKVAAARAEAANREMNGKRGTRKASRA